MSNKERIEGNDQLPNLVQVRGELFPEKDLEQAMKEIEAITAEHRFDHIEQWLGHVAAHPQLALHKLLQWNDAKAADIYRRNRLLTVLMAAPREIPLRIKLMTFKGEDA